MNLQVDDVRLKRLNLARGIPLTQMSYVDLYWLGLADVVDCHDVRLKRVEVGALAIVRRDDFAKMTWVDHVKGIRPTPMNAC